MIYGVAQTIGKRKEQQDSFLVREFPECNCAVALVADGMGGLESGAFASDKIAYKIMEEIELKLKEEMTEAEISELLVQTSEKAGKELVDWCTNRGTSAGSTLALVLIQQRKLFFCAIGDSRIYLYRNNRLIQVNEDHSLKNYLLRCSLRREEVSNLQGSIYSFLGQEPIKEIDYSRKSIPMTSEDMILICSDGVYQALSEQEIQDMLPTDDLQKTAEMLLRRVLEKKLEQQDNATLAILSCSED